MGGSYPYPSDQLSGIVEVFGSNLCRDTLYPNSRLS
jgi:hypothetical protein